MKKSIPFYQSKTFWLNIIAGALTLAGVLTAPDSSFHLGEKGLSIVAGVTTVLNLALRLFSTSKPIEGTNT
ncbi:MAG: hypothetical protein JWO92_1119 [Chitinophagaceae bacterium]|nr:hypothetical protein [Chitinophagaceae bacterium]